jgi:hypothetical protein
MIMIRDRMHNTRLPVAHALGRLSDIVSKHMAYILVATFALLIPLLRILQRIVCFYTHTGIYIRLIIDSAVEIPRANVPRIAKQQAILGVEEELDWSSVPRHRVSIRVTVH